MHSYFLRRWDYTGRQLGSSLSPRTSFCTGINGFTKPSSHVSILASVVNLRFLYCSHVPVWKFLDSISSEVARLLKEEREKRGLSLNVVAQRAGLSRQTVSYVEQEVQNPTLDTLLRITSVLEVDLEKIIAKARKHASGARLKAPASSA